LLKEHGDVPADRAERRLVERFERLALDLDRAGIGAQKAVHVLQEHALARAAAAQDAERLAGTHLEVEPAQDGLVAKALDEPAAPDVGGRAHQRRNSLVRKKSERRKVLVAAT